MFLFTRIITIIKRLGSQWEVAEARGVPTPIAPPAVAVCMTPYRYISGRNTETKVRTQEWKREGAAAATCMGQEEYFIRPGLSVPLYLESNFDHIVGGCGQKGWPKKARELKGSKEASRRKVACRRCGRRKVTENCLPSEAPSAQLLAQVNQMVVTEPRQLGTPKCSLGV